MRTRSTKKMRFLPLVCGLLILCLLGGSLMGCADRQQVNTTALLSDGKHEIPVWFYEFLLSRMKAELARQKYDVNSAAFWDSPITEGSSVSWRESCENSVLDTLRMYLAALVLFDENGLKLTDEYYSSIDEDLDMYLDLDADGSKSAFNELLAAYGVSYDTLRQAYADEYRVALLQTYLYGKDGSLIGNNVKEEYFEENYYCFRQVLFAKFYYEYKTDDFGNVIYYDTASGKPVYDSENGQVAYDADGKEFKDSEGQTIYYDEDGKILYDTAKGKPMYVTDEKGNAEQNAYLPGQLEERKKKLEQLRMEIGLNDVQAFDRAVDEQSDDTDGAALYPHGYYLSDIEEANFSDAYLSQILSELKNMDIGDTAIVESEYGYHLIMRYPTTEGDYQADDYKVFFSSFNASLVTQLFRDKCEKLFETFTLSEDAKKSAKDILEIGVNYND